MEANDDVLEQFRAFLHKKALRATDVREGILRAVVARKGHFDIEELVADLKAQGVDVSRATVYRALPLLREAGIVQSTVRVGDRERFESTVGREHHDHLVCTECGEVVEFHFEAFEVLQEEVAEKYGYRLTGHAHELFGVCPKCAGNTK